MLGLEPLKTTLLQIVFACLLAWPLLLIGKLDFAFFSYYEVLCICASRNMPASLHIAMNIFLQNMKKQNNKPHMNVQ